MIRTIPQLGAEQLGSTKPPPAGKGDRRLDPRPERDNKGRPPLPELDTVPPGPWTVRRAFEYCERIAHSHYENFPVASRFLRAELRPHLCALYAFARCADDFADAVAYAGRRAEALDRWDAELRRCYHGDAEHPIFIALRETVARFEIPINPLADLLTAFRVDLNVRRYGTFTELRRYCDLSAAPVGRMVLYVFGYRDPELHRFSDEICTALQLANHWQDVAQDLGRDRIYLPEEDLHHFGVTEDELFAHRLTPAFRDLMRFQVGRTRTIFDRGRPLGDRLRRDLGFELRLIWSSGVRILDELTRVDYNVYRRRPTLKLRGKLGAFANALGWSGKVACESLSRR